MIPELTSLDWSRCAEFSEGRAYQSLVQCARLHGDESFDTELIGGAIALRSSQDRSTTLFNRVIGLGLTEPFDPALVERLAAHYAPSKGAWSLELTPQASSQDVLAMLRTHRLRRGLATAVLAVDCTQIAAGAGSAFSVVRAEPARSLHARSAAEIEASVFGVSPRIHWLLGQAADDRRVRQWLAMDSGQPVGACMTHVDGTVAWFGWSATLATHRGLGVQTALLHAAVRDAAASGCHWVTSETAIGTEALHDASYRNMQRFGFREVYRRHSYIHVPRTGASVAMS
jgi:GNAT superfamily N-acetyltransferase